MSDSDSSIPLKKCAKCGALFPATLEYFSRAYGREKDGLICYCKQCKRRMQTEYRHANPDKVSQSKQAWERANPDKKKASAHRYYLAHRADVLRKCRERRLANPEKFAERFGRYYDAHRETILAKHRAYYAANTDLMLSRDKAKRERNAEKEAARHKRWVENNREKHRTKQRNRRAREASASGTHTARDVVEQLQRQKGRCFYCGNKVGSDYHVDHVVPLALEGSNGPENIVISCPRCNKSKGAKHPMDFNGTLF